MTGPAIFDILQELWIGIFFYGDCMIYIYPGNRRAASTHYNDL